MVYLVCFMTNLISVCNSLKSNRHGRVHVMGRICNGKTQLVRIKGPTDTLKKKRLEV